MVKSFHFSPSAAQQTHYCGTVMPEAQRHKAAPSTMTKHTSHR
ncbi:hypothetical protein [Neokomagataea anthophila]|nr:hypothetical protein [Neokomagataea anthophila]